MKLLKIIFIVILLVVAVKYSLRLNFLTEGQYDPKYMEYDDYEMLLECEKHGLSYNYEKGVCV
jgi:hypothetical protein